MQRESITGMRASKTTTGNMIYEARKLGLVMQAPLRDDKWLKLEDLGGQGDNPRLPSLGRCLGIRCNIWARTGRGRDIIYQLLGGGSHNIKSRGRGVHSSSRGSSEPRQRLVRLAAAPLFYDGKDLRPTPQTLTEPHDLVRWTFIKRSNVLI